MGSCQACVRCYTHTHSPAKKSVHFVVCERNGVKKLFFITQLHAYKQLHDISITRVGINCKCRAKIAHQTTDSAGGNEKGHGLAVAFAMEQVAPAVPHTVDGKLYIEVAVRPFAGKLLLGDNADFDGSGQALQGSSEEETDDGIEVHGDGKARLGARVHICDAGGDGTSRVLTAELSNRSVQ